LARNELIFQGLITAGDSAEYIRGQLTRWLGDDGDLATVIEVPGEGGATFSVEFETVVQATPSGAIQALYESRGRARSPLVAAFDPDELAGRVNVVDMAIRDGALATSANRFLAHRVAPQGRPTSQEEAIQLLIRLLAEP
jgi:hypothetical protein